MDQGKKPVLLVCPYCMENIPELTLIRNANNVIIIVKCSCSPMEKPINVKNLLTIISSPPSQKITQCKQHNYAIKNLYCSTCAIPLCSFCLKSHMKINKDKHIIIENAKLNLICKKHYEEYNAYCNKCYFSICSKCFLYCKKCPPEKIESIDKQAIDLQFASNYSDIDDLYERNKADNQELLKEFKHILTMNSHLLSSSISSIEDEFNSLNKQKDEINSHLKYFYQCLYYTAVTVEDYATLSLRKVFNSIYINTDNTQIFKTIRTGIDIIPIDEMIKIMINHFNRNSIITQDNTNKCIMKLHQYNTYIKTVYKDNDNTSLICISSYYDCFKYNLNTFECKYYNLKCNERTNLISSSLILNNGILLTLESNGTVDFWKTNMNDTPLITTIKTNFQNVMKMIQLQDNRIVLEYNNDFYICDVATFQILSVINYKIYPQDLSIIQLTDSRLVAGLNNKIVIWDVHLFKQRNCLSYNYSSVKWLMQFNDAKSISGHSDGEMFLWDVLNYNCLFVFKKHSAGVTMLLPIIQNESFASSSMIILL